MERPGVALFGTDDGMVAPAALVTPMHVAFKADRAGVDSFYETAVAAGASDNGAWAPGATSTRTTTRLLSSTRTATTSKRSVTSPNKVPFIPRLAAARCCGGGTRGPSVSRQNLDWHSATFGAAGL